MRKWKHLYPYQPAKSRHYAYHLEWDDADYVGISQQPLAKRIGGHYRADNQIGERLRGGDYPRYLIVAISESRTEIRESERRILNDWTPKSRLLNGHYRTNKRQVPMSANAWCYLCRDIYPASEFNRSKHRTNEVTSRCRRCEKMMKWAQWHGRKHGEHPADTYQHCRNIMKANPKIEYSPLEEWGGLMQRPEWTTPT